MAEDLTSAGQSYARQFTASDLALLGECAPELRGVDGPEAVLRAEPERIEELLFSEAAFERVFGSLEGPDHVHVVSPLLLFALSVHRTASELERANYITEWFGPRRRMPVFDVVPLREFLASSTRRLFLSELLASYTHVASGSVVVLTRLGLRRQRFSELDPVRLASLLDVVPEHDRAGLYRRLGDVALFLTGVFPDHTELHGLSDIDRQRLRRAGGARSRGDDERGVDHGTVALLETLGARWYHHALAHPMSAVSGSRLPPEIARRFGEARRILNVLTDSFIFPFRSRWFGISET